MAGLGVWSVQHLLSTQSFNWHLAAQSLARMQWSWLLLSVLAVFATYYGRALRWAVLLRPLKPRPSMRGLLAATVIGFAAITLFGRPGEVVRPYLIARKEQVPMSSQLATLLLERLFDLLMALILFGFALVRVNAEGIAVGPTLSWVLAWGGRFVVLVGAVLLVVLVSFRHFAEPARRRITDALRFLPDRHFQKAEKLLEAFVQGVESTRSDTALVLVLLYSIIEWVLIVVCYWCIVRAFGAIDLTFVDVVIFMGFISFGSVIQLPGIGGGIQVASVIVLTELFGTRLELATAFAFLIWIITFVVIVPPGLLWALRDGIKWASLRQIGREVES